MMTTKPLKLPPDSLTEARIAGLVIIGLLLFLFEAFLPKPVPWLKFGFANIATLVALFWLGRSAAGMVVLLRILLGAFFTGNFLTPGFFLSFLGGMGAFAIMAILHRSQLFGIIAISISGALVHNIIQLYFAANILFDNPVIWYLLPYFILTAILTGVMIGGISYYLLGKIFTIFPKNEHS